MSYGLKLLVPCALALYLVAACQPDLDSLSASYTGSAGSAGSSAGGGNSEGGMGNNTNGGGPPISTCDNGSKDSGETDVDCGGTKCDPCVTGAVCKTNTDCEDKYCKSTTAGLRCVRPTCADKVKNQDETAVDCGGAVCEPCDVGIACDENKDCAGQYCLDGKCAFHCTSGDTEADETGEDCGGAECEPCGTGVRCVKADDCQSQVCSNQKCLAPTCTDGIKNQDESFEDCGGACSEIDKGCDVGVKCNVPDDCTSWICSATTGKCLSDIVVPPTAIIDDFEDGNFVLPVPAIEGRAGNWYPFGDGSSSAAFDISPNNRGTRENGFTTKGKGFTSWGSGVGVDMAVGKKPYDASQYAGITFWARAKLNAPVDPADDPIPLLLTVVFPDEDTDPGGGICTTCDHHYNTSVQVREHWQRYTVKFADIILEGGTIPTPTAFKPNALISTQFRVAGGTTYELFLDDLAFVK